VFVDPLEVSAPANVFSGAESSIERQITAQSATRC
jgi:hypothetical protein